MLTRTKLVISWVQFAISAVIFRFSDLFPAERTKRRFARISPAFSLGRTSKHVIQIIIQNGLAQNVKRILSKLLFCLIALLFSQHKKEKLGKDEEKSWTQELDDNWRSREKRKSHLLEWKHEMKDANYKTKRNDGVLVSLNMTRLYACKERSCVQGAYCVKHSNANMALGALTIFIHSNVLPSRRTSVARSYN